MRKRFAHLENTNRSRVEVSKGGQPLRRIPVNPTQLLSPRTFLVVYYHLLGADPNVVLSLKTEATAPHYRLSVRLYLSRQLRLRFSLVFLDDESLPRGLAHTLCILSLFSVACLYPFLYSPRSLCSILTLHPRGTTHGTHDDAFSLIISTFSMYGATPRSFTNRSSQADSIKLKHALQVHGRRDTTRVPPLCSDLAPSERNQWKKHTTLPEQRSARY